ncbi:MAG: hypothetical protein P4L46_16625 [Fimbriimonas sp.]|nr:hypothetical protein [Fimbriimonas sp.]
MRKPPLTNREKMKFVTTSQQRVRMELVLDFDRPISVLQARESARKLIDHLTIQVEGFEAPVELGEVTLRSAELKRAIKIQVG